MKFALHQFFRNYYSRNSAAMANACNDEMLNYQVCIALSLIFTLALSVYARTQEYFTKDPQRGMKIYFVCGTIKIFIGCDIIHGPLPR